MGFVFENKLLEVDHRCCLCHLHANLKSAGYKGKALKDALWGVAITTNCTAFDVYMSRIEVICPEAHPKLLEVDNIVVKACFRSRL